MSPPYSGNLHEAVASKATVVVTCFMLVYCLTSSSTLKMEATCSSEISVVFQWTTWRYIRKIGLFFQRIRRWSGVFEDSERLNVVCTQTDVARSSVVGWGTILQAERSRVPVSMRWIFFNLLNPSSRTMTLGSTQPLTEMSTRNLLGG
jgi:hypothetical protein